MKYKDYRPLIQYDKSTNGEKLRLLLEYNELTHEIGLDINCLYRWMNINWLNKIIPNYLELSIKDLINHLLVILKNKVIEEYEQIIIEFCVVDFLLNAGFGIKDHRNFDIEPVMNYTTNNKKIFKMILDSINFSSDGYIYSNTTFMQDFRDFVLAHDIMREFTIYQTSYLS